MRKDFAKNSTSSHFPGLLAACVIKQHATLACNWGWVVGNEIYLALWSPPYSLSLPSSLSLYILCLPPSLAPSLAPSLLPPSLTLSIPPSLPSSLPQSLPSSHDRHYFAVPTNSGEQFHVFANLAVWLLNQCGRKITQPEEVIACIHVHVPEPVHVPVFERRFYGSGLPSFLSSLSLWLYAVAM